MKSASTKTRRRVGAACRKLALVASLLSIPAAAHATSFDEAVSGDLSSNPASPTNIGNLTLGNNAIWGETDPTGPIDPVTHARQSVDNDYVTFTVPTGEELSALIMSAGSVIQPTDRLFFGIAQGTSVNVDPSFTSAAGLLGWTLVDSSMIGQDILPALGQSSPANFPAVPGATGFVGSLGAGNYSLWLLDGDTPVTYKLDVVTSAVPEPATWAMMVTAFGIVGATMRRRKRVYVAVA